MSNLPEKTNPLLLSVQYQGQTYFTSQYFHQQYHANKPEGGKYSQLSTFNRLIRGIEAYQNYVDRGDIVELIYKDFKNQPDTVFASVKTLFEASSHNPVMLINATAQVALTHHLDDEISKQTSINANAAIAGANIAPSMEKLQAEMFILQSAASLLRLSETSVLRGLTVITENHGLKPNFLPAYSDEKLTRALGDLLKENGSKLSAVRANPILQSLGYLEQLERRATKGVKKFWSITTAGLQYGKNETPPNNPRQTQPLWYVDKFPELLSLINSANQI